MTNLELYNFGKIATISARETALINRSVTTYTNGDLQTVGQYAFFHCEALQSVSLPNVTTTGSYSFASCYALTSVEIPKLTAVTFNLFSACRSLTRVEFPSATAVSAQAFNGCESLDTLILSADTVATMSNTNALTGTPIAAGTGYVYVPDSLVNSYKAASNWSTYASQIKPLSELPTA